MVLTLTLIVGFVVYYQRSNRGHQNGVQGNNINPGRADNDFIQTAFNIAPIAPAIAVPVTSDTVHLSAKIVETDEAITSNAIPSRLTLSDHPIPSAPPLESNDNRRTA